MPTTRRACRAALFQSIGRPEWPPILWCPSGWLDGRYVVFDQKNTIQVLNDYNTWTPLVTLPGTFEHPATR